MGVLTTMNTRLNDEQFVTLKEIYVERLVDNMSTKDLVIYATDKITEWVNTLTYEDAMVEFKEYWGEYMMESIDEVKEIHAND